MVARRGTSDIIKKLFHPIGLGGGLCACVCLPVCARTGVKGLVCLWVSAGVLSPTVWPCDPVGVSPKDRPAQRVSSRPGFRHTPKPAIGFGPQY